MDDVRERTADEIGTGHIDNTQGALAVDELNPNAVEPFAAVRTKLLGIVDELEQQTLNDMSVRQQNEIDMLTASAELSEKLEAENRALTRADEDLAAEIAQLEIDLYNAQEAAQNCADQFAAEQSILKGY